MSIILGIDPGSRLTGFGVIRLISAKNTVLEPIAFGVIKMDVEASFPLRMKELGSSLEQILKKYQPGIVSIEKIFLGRNADSAFKLGHARGVAMYESAKFSCEVFEYATREVKKGITGKGSSCKEEVQLMVGKLLGLQIKSLDASDALALAVHHAYVSLTKQVITKAIKKNQEFNL